jgi:hypothetical protein
MLSKELQIGRFGRTLEEVLEEYKNYNTKEEYTHFLVEKAIAHMKVSELFEVWEILNTLEYINSPKFGKG